MARNRIALIFIAAANRFALLFLVRFCLHCFSRCSKLTIEWWGRANLSRFRPLYSLESLACSLLPFLIYVVAMLNLYSKWMQNVFFGVITIIILYSHHHVLWMPIIIHWADFLVYFWLSGAVSVALGSSHTLSPCAIRELLLREEEEHRPLYICTIISSKLKELNRGAERAGRQDRTSERGEHKNDRARKKKKRALKKRYEGHRKEHI